MPLAAPPIFRADSSLQSSSEPISVGVIGQGRWGTRLAEAIRDIPRFRVEIVCDLRGERLRESAAPRVTQRVEDVFAAGLEAVFIATNPGAHAALAAAALDSGHHVFVEKPCALGVAEAQSIGRSAQRAGNVVCVGHLLRYHPAYETLLEVARSGALGALTGAVAERIGSRRRSDVSSWWMLAPHDLSVLLALLQGPADTVHLVRSHDDEFLGLLRFGHVPVALRVGSGSTQSRRFAVFGSHAAAWIDELRDPGAVYVSRGESWPVTSSSWHSSSVRMRERELADKLEALAKASAVRLEASSLGAPLQRELAAFAAAIRDHVSLPTDAREALQVVQMLEMGADGLLPSYSMVDPQAVPLSEM